jgi:hypothetical protein
MRKKLYITIEAIMLCKGGGKYMPLFDEGEVVELVDDMGPFPLVRRKGTREIPKMVMMRQLKPYSEMELVV